MSMNASVNMKAMVDVGMSTGTGKGMEKGEGAEQRKALPFDLLFSDEIQRVLALKYTAKYSRADKSEHLLAWPEYAGNSFLLYLLAETMEEGRKAVFSLNRPGYLRDLVRATGNYTPTGNGAVLTDRQVRNNREAAEDLQKLLEELKSESERTEILNAFVKVLRQGARTGKELESAKSQFYFAAGILGVVPNTIW